MIKIHKKYNTYLTTTRKERVFTYLWQHPGETHNPKKIMESLEEEGIKINRNALYRTIKGFKMWFPDISTDARYRMVVEAQRKLLGGWVQRGVITEKERDDHLNS